MPQIETKQRYDWIDTARGIGIILVLFGHISYPYITTEIYTFHIPLLFFLSGIVFNYNKPIKVFIKDEIKRLIIPYYAWALLFFVLPGVIMDFLSTGKFYIDSEYIKYLYMGRLDTIWYLSTLLVMHIISYAVLKLSKGNGLILSAVSVILFVGFYIYYQNGGKSLWFNFDAACMSILFFAAGYLIKNKPDIFNVLQKLSNKKKLVCFIVFLIFNIAFGALNNFISGKHIDVFKNIYTNPVLMVISAFFGIFAAVMLSFMIRGRIFKYIGQNSMVYFIMHQRLYIYVYAYFYTLIGFDRNAGLLNQTINFVILPIAVCAALTVVNMIVVRIKPLSFILGTKTKR